MHHRPIHLRALSLFSVLWLIQAPLYSQQTVLAFDRNVTVPVQDESGALLPYPWSGGFNFCQVSSCDFNNDGQKDLFFFDRSGNRAVILEYTNGSYRINPQAESVLPPLETVAILRDFDCDGKEDILTYFDSGIRAYHNDGFDGNVVQFSLYASKIQSNYGNALQDVFTIPVDVPAWEDVDGDDDLDLLVFNLLGSCVEYHQNMAMEHLGRCDTLVLHFKNDNWGNFTESFSTNQVILNDTCPGFAGGRQGIRHAGSSITAFDADGDADMDILLGDIAYRYLTQLVNGGTPTQALITSQATNYPSNTTAADIAIFPAAYMVDVDQDGLRDMVVAPNSETGSENYRCFLYYKNVGSASIPEFSYQNNTTFSAQTLDFGEGANVHFFDANNDGKMDLLVGNYGYFLPTGDYKPQVAIIENTSDANQTSFRLTNRNFASAGNLAGIATNFHPATGDLDNDGDADLLLGCSDGRLYHFENTAALGNPANMTFITPNFQGIDVGTFAAPFIYDVDQDGKMDVIVGTREGHIAYYRNTTNGTAPAMELQTELWGGVSTALAGNSNGYCSPVLFRNNGSLYLICGSESGFFYLYGNIENNLDGTFTLLDSTVLGDRLGKRTSITLSDFNDDGYPEAVVGNYSGGLYFLDGIFPSFLQKSSQAHPMLLYPNPGTASIYAHTPSRDWFWVEWMDASGRILYRSKQELPAQLQWTPELPGMYVVRFHNAQTQMVQRWIRQ